MRFILLLRVSKLSLRSGLVVLHVNVLSAHVHAFLLERLNAALVVFIHQCGLWKRRRSASEAAGLKEGKQQKIDQFIFNSLPESISITNRYAALESDSTVFPGDEERAFGQGQGNVSMEPNPSPNSHCCQQLSVMMEIFSKGAILTSQTLALLLDKIKVIDTEVNALKAVVNNLAAVHSLNRAGDKLWTEKTTARNLAAGNSVLVSDTRRSRLMASSLIFQRNSVAISFIAQTDSYNWRNKSMIVRSLCQLLNCNNSNILLSSYERLPSIGSYARVVLHFKNDGTSTNLMSRRKLVFTKHGIHVTRVFKDLVRVPLCPTTFKRNDSKRGLGAIPQNGLQQLSSTAESPAQMDPNCGDAELRVDSKMTSGNDIYCRMKDQPLHHGNRFLAGKEVPSPPILPPAGSEMLDVLVGRPPLKCQPRANFEMDLDMRSHWIASMDLRAPIKNKSLADELREADYVLTPQYLTSARNGSYMELEESSSPPSSPAPKKRGPEPACSRKSSLLLHAQEGPDGSLLPSPQASGKLDNSIEDSLLLSFGTLPAQEQQDIIERLEFTKNSLLSLKKSSPLRLICGQTSIGNNSNAIQEGTRLDPSEQNPLEPWPLQYSNNEVPKVVTSTSGAARARGNGSVLVDWEQSLNQIIEVD
ncbi:UNVERIFIED_CONTAM: hypothetical protein K2H54_005549 [Gekko kuhli]